MLEDTLSTLQGGQCISQSGLDHALHQSDVLSLSGLTSGSGTNYGRLSYESLVNGLGTRLGAAYLALDYELSGSLAELKAHGTAQVGSIWGRHPLIRSREFNLYGQVQ